MYAIVTATAIVECDSEPRTGAILAVVSQHHKRIIFGSEKIMSDAIEVLYFWKDRFSNEPYCPLCSKEMYSTGFYDKEKNYFYKSDFVYCVRCKATFIYEKIYFALKKYEPEFKLINRKGFLK